jgi:hypothetical protein
MAGEEAFPVSALASAANAEAETIQIAVETGEDSAGIEAAAAAEVGNALEVAAATEISIESDAEATAVENAAAAGVEPASIEAAAQVEEEAIEHAEATGQDLGEALLAVEDQAMAAAAAACPGCPEAPAIGDSAIKAEVSVKFFLFCFAEME